MAGYELAITIAGDREGKTTAEGGYMGLAFRLSNGPIDTKIC
jgi:hypothetical protein